MGNERAPPHIDVLLKRLQDYNEFSFFWGKSFPDATQIANMIKRKALEGAICAGALVDGKWRALRFEDYYEQVFGIGLDGKALKKPRKRA